MTRQITSRELAEHKSSESCWIAIAGAVYDLTSYLSEHPGGVARLLQNAGQDGTESYQKFHPPELVSEILSSQYIGSIDETTFESSQDEKSAVVVQSPTEQTVQAEPLVLVRVDDFEKEALRKMSASTAAWLESGADNELTKRWNRNDFSKISLRPRVLRDVSDTDTKASIMGFTSSLPVFISPTGITKLAHENGECELTVAAGLAGIVQVVSTAASVPIEAVMEARTSPDQPIFFQLYVNKDIEKTKTLLKRVKKAGVKAIWVTVDSPLVGKREKDERIKAREEASLKSNRTLYTTGGAGIARSVSSWFATALQWEDLSWIREMSGLPIVIKGIQCVEDALLAYEYGVEGIVISNHGGRSQDSAQSSLLTLLEIRKYAPHIINSSMEIYLDGGVRRGTDILKALALGATAVGMGRPFVSALAVGGREAVAALVEIIRSELTSNMVLSGARTLKDIELVMLNTTRLERDLTGAVKL